MSFKSNIFVLSFFSILLGTETAQAAVNALVRGENHIEISLETALNEIPSVGIVVIGEMHGLAPLRDQQMEILNGLRKRGYKVAVGMEFLNYTDQSKIDQFTSRQISDEEFKTLINWGNNFDFNLYKDQILFPLKDAATLGLNMPSEVTRSISRNGIDSLTLEQNALLPPNFTLGRDSYKERFFKAMGHPVPPEKQLNYFTAQSLWDDTMAWQTVNYVTKNPDQIFVIIVGEFHVQYGGGLPNRLNARLAEAGFNLPITTFSQIWAEGLTETEIKLELEPSPIEGPRANYIWITQP